MFGCYTWTLRILEKILINREQCDRKNSFLIRTWKMSRSHAMRKISFTSITAVLFRLISEMFCIYFYVLSWIAKLFHRNIGEWKSVRNFQWQCFRSGDFPQYRNNSISDCEIQTIYKNPHLNVDRKISLTFLRPFAIASSEKIEVLFILELRCSMPFSLR